MGLKMVTDNQLLTIQKQCESFTKKGHVTAVEVKTKGLSSQKIVHVNVKIGKREYNFSDPCPDIIIQQLSKLYQIYY